MKTQSWFKPYFDRLSSMSLAIALLTVLALASAIGTVLLQNQEQTDYLTQFGPLWYNVFVSLGLFDMYHAPWFFSLLVFLMISLSVCLWRNVPVFLKEMRSRKVVIADKSLKGFHHLKRWKLDGVDVAEAKVTVSKALSDWSQKSEEEDGRLYIRGDKGRSHKWGYILVHSAILVILIGGWVGAQYGFRGTMSVVENGTDNTIRFLKGTKTEQLKMPFDIRCDDFFIDFYPTGMPKEFRSTLSILEDGKVVVDHKDIIVNEPLFYKGVRIYQASFGDGGSAVSLKLFDPVSGKSRIINTEVYKTWKDPETGISLEITNFRPFNIENMAGPGEAKKFQDLGPAVEFVVRGPDLKSVKVKSFLNPFILNGQNRGHMIMVSLSGNENDFQPYPLGLDLSQPTDWQLYEAFGEALSKRPGQADQEANFAAFREAMNKVFGKQRPDDFQEKGMRVLQAMSNLPGLPWPYIPMLEDHHQVYYTGLEVTQDPGMNTVWVGSALLVIGLCIMFYVPHRKLWVVLKAEGKGVEITLGAMTNRNKLGFEHEFNQLLTRVDEALRPSTQKRSAA
jgi:cytochrome c biogenesis protein